MAGPRLLNIIALWLVLSTPLATFGQTIPSDETCQNTVNSLGANTLLVRLAPCQSDPTGPRCCDAANNVAGFRPNAPLAGCLCNPGSLNLLISTAESNQLARSAGVNRQLILKTLQGCGVPHSGGTGAAACPAGGAAAAPGPAAGPAASPAAGPAASPAAGPTPTSTTGGAGPATPATGGPQAAPAPPAEQGVKGGYFRHGILERKLDRLERWREFRQNQG